MNPKYPIYIISKGRWESRLTVKELERMQVPYHIVIEPQEYDRYVEVINKKNIWESSPFIFVQHPTGDYIKHFIVEDNGKIIDPFLDVEIPADSYKQIYRNPDEIRIV